MEKIKQTGWTRIFDMGIRVPWNILWKRVPKKKDEMIILGLNFINMP